MPVMMEITMESYESGNRKRNSQLKYAIIMPEKVMTDAKQHRNKCKHKIIDLSFVSSETAMQT